MQVELENAELQEQYDTLLAQYKYVYASLAILVEEGGGLLKIDRETLEDYDLRTSIQMWPDENDASWNIQVTPHMELPADD